MRKIPGKLFPHRALVIVEPYLGGGASGRTYGAPITIRRALIVDADEIVNDQYDAETSSATTVFFARSEVDELPTPETRVTVRAGTKDERKTHVIKCLRHEYPSIADLLEVKLA